MTRRKNPYSTHWDKQIRLSRLTGESALLYSAFEIIQTTLYYEGTLWVYNSETTSPNN